MGVAEGLSEQHFGGLKGDAEMREIFSDVMQLLAIIMIMVTLAVSMAAVSQMLG